MTRSRAPISVIIPACRRIDSLLKTLSIISACDPAPDEILVHVDGSSPAVVEAVRMSYPDVRIQTSEQLRGPGGARNHLIADARHELVANFDDDSFPARGDYFARVLEIAGKFPNAAVFSAASHEPEWRSNQFQQIAMPSGCGCVFRKSWFQRTWGFVPLPIAYNMEEVDIGLQLHSLGGMIVHDPLLRVIHDRPLSAEVDALTNAHVLANTALFSYLRFPAWLWPVGALSVFRRVLVLLSWGWTAGLLNGLRMIPDHLVRHKQFRHAIPSRSILTWLFLKRWPSNLGDAGKLADTSEAGS